MFAFSIPLTSPPYFNYLTLEIFLFFRFFTKTQTATDALIVEQKALRNLDNCLKTKIYSYIETSGGQSSNVI